MKIRDVEEASLRMTEVDECGLDGRLDVRHSTAVDVAHRGRRRHAFDKQFLKMPVLENRDSRFFTGHVVDKHQLFWLRCLFLGCHRGTSFPKFPHEGVAA